jgi:hypothetical protein
MTGDSCLGILDPNEEAVLLEVPVLLRDEFGGPIHASLDLEWGNC